MPTHQIDVGDDIDRYQWSCPTAARHRNWEFWNGYIRCIACEREAARCDLDRDGLYQELRNLRTGKVVARENIEIVDSGTGSWRQEKSA